MNKKAIAQMVLATAICAAVIIPGMLWVKAGTEKEQAKKVEPNPVSMVEIAPRETPAREVISYYSSIPLDKELQHYIIVQSHAHGIQPQIVMAMIDRESGFDIEQVGDNGNSFGLMQIQPRWHYGRMLELESTDLFNPYHNVTVGIDYLAEKLDKYDGDMAKALVAYNQGSYKGTVTAYAKAVLENAEKIGGADVYAYS